MAMEELYLMKATGIIRRIDDLGRVVVPKEIRRTLKIREGDPLEIFTDREGEIVLKKYSPIGEIREFAVQYTESLGTYINHAVIMSDRDIVVAATSFGRELIDKNLSKECEDILENRMLVRENTKGIRITDNDEKRCNKVIKPIICEGDVIGGIALMAGGEDIRISDEDVKLIEVAAHFIGRQMEA